MRAHTSLFSRIRADISILLFCEHITQHVSYKLLLLLLCSSDSLFHTLSPTSLAPRSLRPLFRHKWNFMWIKIFLTQQKLIINAHTQKMGIQIYIWWNMWLRSQCRTAVAGNCYSSTHNAMLPTKLFRNLSNYNPEWHTALFISARTGMHLQPVCVPPIRGCRAAPNRREVIEETQTLPLNHFHIPHNYVYI